MANLRDLANELQTYCGFLPPQLARRWIQRAFDDAQRRALWACQVAEETFFVPAGYTTGTVTVTQGSTAVTGSGTVWTSSMIGRQFWIGGEGPYYTVLTVPSGTSLTLDRTYGNSSGSGKSYEIGRVYLTPPSDFLALIGVLDPVNSRRLRWGIPKMWLDRRDPDRSSSGTPRLLVDNTFDANGVPRFELWERVSVESSFPYHYYRKRELAAETDVLPKPFSDDTILEGALARLARWPGEENRQNPLFSLEGSRAHERVFEDHLRDLMRLDQEIYMTDWGFREFPLSPVQDAKWLQSHDPDGVYYYDSY